jgi:hypothetical protein
MLLLNDAFGNTFTSIRMLLVWACDSCKVACWISVKRFQVWPKVSVQIDTTCFPTNDEDAMIAAIGQLKQVSIFWDMEVCDVFRAI